MDRKGRPCRCPRLKGSAFLWPTTKVQRIIDLLRRNSQLGAIQEASDGLSAVDIIQNRRPDLVFLDVQMPELNGLEVIAEVGAGRMPLTVFVTAYDQHAIRAFEANALDYLLKPFSDERFEATM